MISVTEMTPNKHRASLASSMSLSRKHVLLFSLYFLAYAPSYSYSKISNFNARLSAESLKRALYAEHTSTIVKILTDSTYGQRHEIVQEYQKIVGKQLKEELQHQVNDEVKDLLVALVLPLPIFYATELHRALIGFGTDEQTLIDILCTLTSSQIWMVSDAYESEFRRKLVDDIKSDTSGDFEDLLVSLLRLSRDESTSVNRPQAAEDAKRLLRAGVEKVGTDELIFYNILCTRNYKQLALIFDEYQRLSGHDIEEAIKNEFSGYAKVGFLALIAATRNLPLYFARRLDECLTAKSVRSDQLNRFVATRSEIDLEDIKKEYVTMYHVPLKADVYAHTEGFYQDALLNLIGLD